ncbi:MAG: hypothetical protein VX077_07275, partial [Pseudomonadota bacterium]|nr:hypothetical protein [Pseudomonadota bacterium]
MAKPCETPRPALLRPRHRISDMARGHRGPFQAWLRPGERSAAGQTHYRLLHSETVTGQAIGLRLAFEWLVSGLRLALVVRGAPSYIQ